MIDEIKIREIVNNIYTSYNNRNTQPLSLLLGEAGYCLFEKVYLEFSSQKINEDFEIHLQHLAEYSFEETSPTFCNGKAGLNWFFTYLKNSGILSKRDWKIICDDDDYKLAYLANEFLMPNKNPDFLHGGIGIAYYLLYSRSKDKTYKWFFRDFFKKLETLIIRQNDKAYFPDFDIVEQYQKKDKVNLGVAHGVPSILKYCLQSYKYNICRREAKKIFICYNTNAERPC